MLESAPKIALYSALLLLEGACMARWLAGGGDQPDRRFARLGTVSAAVVVAALIVRLVLHTAAVFGFADTWSWESISTVGLESRWGGGWRAQLIAAFIVLLVSIWSVRTTTTRGLVLTSLTVLVLVFTYPLVGHAGGSSFRLLVAALHLVGAGAWLGTLAVLVLTDHRGSLFRRFSAIAFTGVATVVFSGVVMAVLYIGDPRNLWTSAYGRVFLLKIALFLMVGACGWVNWRRVSVGNLPPPVAWLETTFAAAIVIVTAFLTEMAHP